jgi:hypothetical protein
MDEEYSVAVAWGQLLHLFDNVTWGQLALTAVGCTVTLSSKR